MSRSLTFHVAGTPVTQGSKRAFARNGHAWVVETGGRNLAAWRHAINDEARRALGEALPLRPPVRLQATFTMPRPKSLPKRRRTWPVGARSGDVDKLGRAVLDAVTGVLITDDAHVLDLNVKKDWALVGEGPGVSIRVEEVGDDE